MTEDLKAQLQDLLPEWLPRQRWYSGSDAPAQVEVTNLEVLVSGGTDQPGVAGFASVIVRADGIDWHVPVGWRTAAEVPPSVADREGAVIGILKVDGDLVTAFDAPPDQDLAVHFHCLVTGEDTRPDHVRPVDAEQSNTSLVSDDRIVLKLFRRLMPGANPDVEVPSALGSAGFPNVPEVHGVWRRGGYDLAVAQTYLPGATDGSALALASLRECLGSGESPELSGGDFGAEAARLGQMTGELHVALARAFGSEEGTPKQWAADLARDLERAGVDTGRAADLLGRLESVGSPGAAIRGHGDYHLGQVLRADAGWFVLDFEGEPDRTADERARRSSPLRDLAGIVRSLDYAAAIALAEHVDDDRQRHEPLAAAWVAHNSDAMQVGYLATEGLEELLPDPVDRPVVLAAFQLEKAIYELNYERAHRPEWEWIPAAAIEGLLTG